MITLEPLYKNTKTNSIQVCIISYENDTYYTEFGKLNGAMQTTTTQCFTTNAGRSNERTPEQQAEFEAKAKWNAKVKSGYTIDIESPTELELPMKIKIYQEHINSIPDFCYQAPKLNGVNGEFRIVNDKLILLSRGGNEYPMLEHLRQPVYDMLIACGQTRVAGELYIHGEFLQDITGAVKKFKANITPRIEFHVFDFPLVDGDFSTRLNFMNSINYGSDFIRHIRVLTTDEISIDDFHAKCVGQGFEGTVIYDPANIYEYNIRTSNIWKYKIPRDGEYLIYDYNTDKNGHPVFHCLVNSSLPASKENTFKVKPKGTAEERALMLENIDLYINQWYNIEYEMLSKDNVPQKPVGIGLRDCDSQGNPLT